MSESQNKKSVVTDTEIGDNGVVHSKVQGSVAGAKEASVAELNIALVEATKTIEQLKAELNAKNAAPASNGNNIVKELVDALKGLNAAGPTESDNINKSSDFTNKMTVDGRSLMEAQQSLLMFKSEVKKPISIPKAFANQFGPALAITVNGVRVSIPVDGRTYFINKTHWEHARERMAKMDRQLAKTEPQIVETNA